MTNFRGRQLMGLNFLPVHHVPLSQACLCSMPWPPSVDNPAVDGLGPDHADQRSPMEHMHAVRQRRASEILSSEDQPDQRD